MLQKTGSFAGKQNMLQKLDIFQSLQDQVNEKYRSHGGCFRWSHWHQRKNNFFWTTVAKHFTFLLKTNKT